MRTIDTASMSAVYVAGQLPEVFTELRELLGRGAGQIVIEDDRDGGGGFQIHHDAPTPPQQA